jgi:CRP-like cAMP-binding protein
MLIEQRTIPEQFFSSAFLADELFGGLLADRENSLFALKREELFARGETIFARGELPRSILVALEGEAEIFYGGATVVQPLKRNVIWGLTESVANLPYEMSLKAATDCRFDAIDRDAFLAFLQTEPEVCFRLLQMLGANLQRLYRLFQ